MADHSELQTTTNYALLLALLHERMTDLAKALDGVGTNLPTGAVRWDSAAKKWRKWNGSAWVDLVDIYEIKAKAANITCNAVMGQTNVQSALEALAGVIPSGTRMLFQQSTAPTGWTKVTDHNDKALRVVSGTASYGGAVAFSTAMTETTTGSTAAGGNVEPRALSVEQLASHVHQERLNGKGYISSSTSFITGGGSDTLHDSGATTKSAGSGLSHDHAFTGAAHSHLLNMNVQYVDVIIASKN